MGGIFKLLVFLSVYCEFFCGFANNWLRSLCCNHRTGECC